MQRRSALDRSGMPPGLLKTSPRHVQMSVLGSMMMLIAAVLVIIGVWGGIDLTIRAERAARRFALFASERIVTAGEVVRMRARGGDDDRRMTAHYTYLAGGRQFPGATTLRRGDRDRYTAGSQVAVWYLASEPGASWLDGYSPRLYPRWPAALVLFGCVTAALGLIYAVHRQSHLLIYGRPAMATVTKVEKKTGESETYWMVHYQWRTMSGAVRVGKYRHGKKEVPAIGNTIPIVYDRDDTYRHSKYPLQFVKILT